VSISAKPSPGCISFILSSEAGAGSGRAGRPCAGRVAGNGWPAPGDRTNPAGFPQLI
jgi:hypothetical protein